MPEAGERIFVLYCNFVQLIVFQVDQLYQCCDLFYQRNGDDASTVSCPKANLLRYDILAMILCRRLVIDLA